MIGRVLRTGLLGRVRALFHGLGPKGEHPSREKHPYPGVYIYGQYIGQPNPGNIKAVPGLTIVGRIHKRGAVRWMTDAELQAHTAYMSKVCP